MKFLNNRSFTFIDILDWLRNITSVLVQVKYWNTKCKIAACSYKPQHISSKYFNVEGSRPRIGASSILKQCRSLKSTNPLPQLQKLQLSPKQDTVKLILCPRMCARLHNEITCVRWNFSYTEPTKSLIAVKFCCNLFLIGTSSNTKTQLICDVLGSWLIRSAVLIPIQFHPIVFLMVYSTPPHYAFLRGEKAQLQIYGFLEKGYLEQLVSGKNSFRTISPTTLLIRYWIGRYWHTL